jgi:NADH-quinone oxidoreductase subunit N
MDQAALSNVASLAFSLPELVLGASIVALFLLDLVVKRKPLLGDFALLALAIVVILSARLLWSDSAALYNGAIVLDGFALFFKLLLSLAAFVTVWMSLGSREIQRSDTGEYWPILLASTLGMLFMASATNSSAR